MGIIKGLLHDIKTDCQALATIGKRMQKGEPLLDPMQRHKFRKGLLEGWGEFFMKKDTWLFFSIVVLAFLCGWFVAGKHYQNECNIHIIETYHPGEYEKVGRDYVRIVDEPNTLLRDTNLDFPTPSEQPSGSG